jgi:hypothetical protein
MPLVFEPIKSGNFDKTYFYLLANSLDAIKSAGLQEKLLGEISMSNSKDPEFKTACSFIKGYLEGSSKESKKAAYSPSNYKSKDGKLTIVQVFDEEDNRTPGWTSWPGAQKNARRIGEPANGKHGELVYENATTRIILVNKDEGANKEFLKSFLDENPNAIVTFRGHSYSLHDNVPPEIFENRQGNILFIPGSCGSSGAVPDYKQKNPQTSMVFFSNTSTGRGRVTETILSALLDPKSAGLKYSDILEKYAKQIEAAGGDIKTIQVYSLGEQLLDHVARR